MATRDLTMRPVQLLGESGAGASAKGPLQSYLEGPGPAKARRLAAAVLKVGGPALLAVAACIFCYVVGWRGTDWAAQIYRVGQVVRYGIPTGTRAGTEATTRSITAFFTPPPPPC